MVQQGALGALGPDQYTLGLQCAAMIAEVLSGKSPRDLPVQFPAKTERYLNMKIAESLNLSFSEDQLKKIDQVLF